MSSSVSDSPLPRVALITGANTGIGRVTALALAEQGFHVLLACRSLERTRPVLEEIQQLAPGTEADWLPLELSDLDSVRKCAGIFLDRGLPLHLLVNNAGLAGARGLTRSGFEFMFGVNHIGHFLLTNLLLDRLRQSAPARIVTVASRAHTLARGMDWDALRRPTSTWLGVKEYAVSKLANVLFSAELGRRLAGSGVITAALHPGVIDSDIWRTLTRPLRALNRLRLISPQEGAATTLHCALAPVTSIGTSGYFSDCRPVQPSSAGRDPALAAELWRRSEAWTR